MTTAEYDPSTALRPFYADRDERRIARVWANEALLHDFSEVFGFEFFEGYATNPTGLAGYASDKIWLRVEAGVTTTSGEVRLYDGSGDATLLASWPVMDKDAFASYLGIGGVSATDLASTSDAAKGTALVGYKSTATSAVGRTLSSKLVEMISAKDFGAVGDGVTDDTAAIQAALNAAAARGGGVVLLPASTNPYLLTATPSEAGCHLVMTSTMDNVKLIGWGATLKSSVTDKTILRLKGGCANFTMMGVTLDRAGTAAAGGHGIEFTGSEAPKASFYHVEVKYQYDGVNADGARPNLSRWVDCFFTLNVRDGISLGMNNGEYFANCVSSQNGRRGINIGGSTNLPSNGEVMCANCTFWSNGENNIHIEGYSADYRAYLIKFVNCAADVPGARNLYIKRARQVFFSGQLQWATTQGLYIDDDSQEITISGSINDCGGHGAVVTGTGTKNINLSNVRFISNGRTGAGYSGLVISNGASHITAANIVSCNGQDYLDAGSTIDRQKQSYGVNIDASTATPTEIYISGHLSTNLTSATTSSGSVSATVHIETMDGATREVKSAQKWSSSNQPVTVNSTNSAQYKVAIQDNGAARAFWGASATDLFDVATSGGVQKARIDTNGRYVGSGVYINNTGLEVADTDASHALTIKPGSNLTANRTLTLTTGDADVSVDLANMAVKNANNSFSTTQTIVFSSAGTNQLNLRNTHASGLSGANMYDEAGSLVGWFHHDNAADQVTLGGYNGAGQRFQTNNITRFTITHGGEMTVRADVATPAGGSTDARLLFGTTAGFGVYYGSGAPSVSAGQGSIYLRSDGSSTSTRLYVNTDGSTTWTNVTTAA